MLVGINKNTPTQTLPSSADEPQPLLFARKQGRVERRVTEVMAVILADERHICSTNSRARRRTARALSAA
ncbi:hypothetical protein [Variovorax sp. YR566]|uniref:hypothetical protein n=1 Tax=Variovorax sp. YR566 TaxID=3450237 RepID=UPI003F81629C